MSGLTDGIGPALRQVLVDDSAVAALVGARVFPLVREGGALPALAYSIVEAQPDAPDLGAVGAAQSVVAVVDLSCVASTQDGADALAGAVEAALDGYLGAPLGGPPRLHISVRGRVDTAMETSDTAAGELERHAKLRIAVRRF